METNKDLRFEVGDVVFLQSDPEQKQPLTVLEIEEPGYKVIVGLDRLKVKCARNKNDGSVQVVELVASALFKKGTVKVIKA